MVLQIENLVKRYSGKAETITALDELNLTVEKGEFVTIMGASGCGKTSLLNCISGIDIFDGGKIWIDNQDLQSQTADTIAEFRSNVLGFIFQDCNLLDSLTVHENIALALSIQGVSANEIDHRVTQMVEVFGIGKILQAYPHEISGGQKQRVAAIRAIIKNPSLVIADEPTGALDSKSSQIFLEYIAQANAERGCTILMVTHDFFSASYSSRVLFMKDGKIQQQLHKNKMSRQEFMNAIIAEIGSAEVSG